MFWQWHICFLFVRGKQPSAQVFPVCCFQPMLGRSLKHGFLSSLCGPFVTKAFAFNCFASPMPLGGSWLLLVMCKMRSPSLCPAATQCLCARNLQNFALHFGRLARDFIQVDDYVQLACGHRSFLQSNAWLQPRQQLWGGAVCKSAARML